VRRRRAWIHPIILLALLRISLSCIADEEFLCEEAVSHIADCCPSARDQVDCKREFNACSGFQCSPHYSKTEFSVKASQCVIGKSCAELAGTCQAVASPNTDDKSVDRVEAEACR
jgi:hypothetical protein